MKIVLLNPPAADVAWFGDKANFEAPLGLAMLAAYVRERGHEPVIVDVAAERLTPDETVARVAAQEAALVGITFKKDAAAVWQETAKQRIFVSGGQRMRLSSHIHTRPSDIDQFFDIVEAKLGKA